MQVKYGAKGLIALSWLYLTAACGGGNEAGDHQHKQAEADRESLPEVEESAQIVESYSPDNRGSHSGDHEDIRGAGAHLHGNAKLAIAVDGNALVIEFESPVYNLTGFEHSPQTDDDHEAVEKVEALLAAPGQLFIFSDEAGCQPESPSTPVSLGLADTTDHRSDHEHDHDDKSHNSVDTDDHSDHDSEHGHGHGNESGSGHSDSHSDVIVEYQYQCAAPADINEVEVKLFDLFPRIEELDVVFLDQTRQRSATLNRNNARLELDP